MQTHEQQTPPDRTHTASDFSPRPPDSVPYQLTDAGHLVACGLTPRAVAALALDRAGGCVVRGRL